MLLFLLSFVLGSEDGQTPTFWLLLYSPGANEPRLLLGKLTTSHQNPETMLSNIYPCSCNSN